MRYEVNDSSGGIAYSIEGNINQATIRDKTGKIVGFVSYGKISGDVPTEKILAILAMLAS